MHPASLDLGGAKCWQPPAAPPEPRAILEVAVSVSRQPRVLIIYYLLICLFFPFFFLHSPLPSLPRHRRDCYIHLALRPFPLRHVSSKPLAQIPSTARTTTKLCTSSMRYHRQLTSYTATVSSTACARPFSRVAFPQATKKPDGRRVTNKLKRASRSKPQGMSVPRQSFLHAVSSW